MGISRSPTIVTVFVLISLGVNTVNTQEDHNTTWPERNLSRSSDSHLNAAREKDSSGTEQRAAAYGYLTILKHDLFADGHSFCRIASPCRLGNGTVLLPAWMKPHSNRVAECGIASVQYITDERDESGSITRNYDFQGEDLVGNYAPPGEPPFLAEDLAPRILTMDMLLRPAIYQNATKVFCEGSEGTGELKGKECFLQHHSSNESTFKPVIFVDSRVAHTKDFMWAKSLLRLVRNSVKGELSLTDLKNAYGWRVRSQAMCFRSLISSNVKTMDIPPAAIQPDNVFFSLNDLTRKSTERMKNDKSTCNVKVLILNRYGRRYIVGGEALVSAISSQGRALSERLLVESEETFFENSSFHEQVSIMQEADIVVATHGDANANFLFLRPSTRIFEILPFGVSFDVYKNLSTTFGAVYQSVRSQPDTEVFAACVEHFNMDKQKLREQFMANWERAAKEFTEETIHKEANVESNFSLPDDESSDLKMLRRCAWYQRISVDVRHLASKVVAASASQCGI